MSLSVKLPLREKTLVVSIKLHLKETVSLLSGFVMSENIIEMKQDSFVLVENVKSFITTQVSMIDKNHILLKWFGNSVPTIQIFRRRVDEEYGITPYKEVPWNPSQYIMDIDGNSYVIKVIGSNKTGEGQEYTIGASQSYSVDMDLQLPRNEKRFYFDIDIITKYEIEVNI